jgi:hypothetical protein
MINKILKVAMQGKIKIYVLKERSIETRFRVLQCRSQQKPYGS